jgi:hypothetical protein
MTPKFSKCNSRGQNSSHQKVLYIIGKLSKCRCRKWARMSHLDIYSTSYDKKKGRESNWQFDSRPLKVGNRPDPGVCRWSATHLWKDLEEGSNFGLDLIAKEVMRPQSCRSPSWNFGGPTWESQDKKPFECGPHGELQSILYGRRWWLPPSPGCGESSESKVACGSS